LVVLDVLGAPAVVVVLAMVALAAVAGVTSNALAGRWPGLLLPVLRWPEELRTLRTPAGRVGLGIVAIVVVALALAPLAD
jgi:hypothetical protein